jgi:hypothetical protein
MLTARVMMLACMNMAVNAVTAGEARADRGHHAWRGALGAATRALSADQSMSLQPHVYASQSR